MATLYADRVRVLTATTGTGTMNLGAATPGARTFAAAVTAGALVSGCTVPYTIEDGVAWEVGAGVYTAGSPDTLTRVVAQSSQGGTTALTLSGNAQVYIAMTAEVAAPLEAGAFATLSASISAALTNPALLGAAPDQSLDLNFLSGVLDSRISFTRASTATYFDATGTMQTAAANAPRFDHAPAVVDSPTAPYANAPLGLLIEESRTNSLPNSTMVGAVVGTPGTLPTGWGAPVLASGLSLSVIGTGTESGIPYIDLQFSGTPSATTQCYFTTGASLTAATAQVWTGSGYLRLTAGTLANVSNLGFYVGVFGGTGTGMQAVTPTGAALASQRSSVSITAGAGTTSVQPYVVFTPTASGVAVNFTIRIGAPQLELGAFATSFIPTSGSTATRAADVATMPVGMAALGGGPTCQKTCWAISGMPTVRCMWRRHRATLRHLTRTLSAAVPGAPRSATPTRTPAWG